MTKSQSITEEKKRNDDISLGLPDKVVSIDVGTNNFHAAGVDQTLNVTLHTGIDDILRSWEERWRMLKLEKQDLNIIG